MKGFDIRYAKDGECWRDSQGTAHRWHTQGPFPLAFESWSNPFREWVVSPSPGVGPFERCPDPSKPRWRTGYGILAWAVQHLDRELETPYGSRYRVFCGPSGILSIQRKDEGAWYNVSTWNPSVDRRPVEGTW